MAPWRAGASWKKHFALPDAVCQCRCSQTVAAISFRANPGNHATVARIKSAITADVAGALQQVAPVDGVSQHVTHLTLMRSELGSQGAIYHQVKEFALKKSK